MASIALFTIASKNYLGYVRTLFSSVAQLHPEYKLFLCLTDRPDGYFDPVEEPYDIVLAEQLEIDSFHDMILRYDIMELSTAVKPFMFKWLFDNTKSDTVIYLDPDIRVYSKIDQIESSINSGASVVLTPHITEPLEDGKTPNDSHMLKAGVFNLGFIAASRCDEAFNFIDWWGRRLKEHCLADFSANLFVDQKWCDLAPCFLDNLRVLRDPGYNIAYWNLAHRRVTRSNLGNWEVNGRPLAFFHFSGIDLEQIDLVSKYQDRFKLDDVSECRELFESYVDQLILNGLRETRGWPYAYSETKGGLNIGPLIRQIYRLAGSKRPVFGDDDLDEYLVWLCNQLDEEHTRNSEIPITRLMGLVYSLRQDVREAFDIATVDGRRQFASWFEVAGEREYGLPVSITGSGNACKSERRFFKKKFYQLTVLSDKSLKKLSSFLPGHRTRYRYFSVQKNKK